MSRLGERTGALAGVAALHGLALLALLHGAGPPAAEETPARPLTAFDIAEVVPPSSLLFEEALAERAEGVAAPPNRVARPAPIAAPPSPAESPVAAAPIAGNGAENMVGAADPGPGAGAGGTGSGLGAGAGGTGTGGGAGGPRRARHLSGAISQADYPRAAWRARAGGAVTARLSVDAEGRVAGCAVIGSSGNDALDEATCRLIRERFRYAPALDAAGRPVPSVMGWRQTWWLERG